MSNVWNAAGKSKLNSMPWRPRVAVKENQHSDVAILRSFPGVGRTVAARVLSEAADAIRHRDLRRLRTLGGSAPVTKQSGKTRHVAMRRACNKWLRYAYYHWGRTAIQQDASIMTHYRALRARGKSHGRALAASWTDS